MKRFFTLLIVLCVLTGILGGSPVMAFSDTNDHWASQAVDTWTGYGILKGYDAKTFGPDRNINRAEMATLICRLMGYVEMESLSEYTDVNERSWYAESLAKILAAGVMSGYGNGKMGPDDLLTRQDAVVILGRAFGIDPVWSGNTGFYDDMKISDYALFTFCP